MNIVITGSTKGIGKACCDIFAPVAAQLFITSRTVVDLKEQKKSLQNQFPELTVHAYAADFQEKRQVENFGHYINDQVKHVDILINNAGLFIPGEIINEADGILQEMLGVNLISAYILTRKLVPGMIQAGKGHIFNMCSIASIAAYANGGSYSISKYALYGFTKNLREELKTHGIKVTAVLPGATWSASWAGIDLPEERLMQANDIAQCIFNAASLSPSAVVEEIILRPQLGDL